MLYEVRHRSTYRYERRVDLSYHMLHLLPRELPWQRVVEAQLHRLPGAAPATRMVDYFGNTMSFVSLTKPHDKLVFEMSARVEVTPRAPYDATATPAWEIVRDALAGDGYPEDWETAEFTLDSPMVTTSDAVAAFAAPDFPPGRPIFDAVRDLTRRIRREFIFDSDATGITTPLAEILEKRRGVCQDFAHLQIAALRSLGLAARYVSGYIRTYSPKGRPRLVGADASHAWVGFFCPGIGWIDVDPTNDLVVGEDHIVLGWGRDYSDVSPIRGVILGGGEHTLSVGVDVAPLG